MIVACTNCTKEKRIYPSQLKRDRIFFCNRSCHRSYKNKVANPVNGRDLTGENNPMWGKHPQAWNKGLTGEASFNWKGGIHQRKDGYVRVRIDGKRFLLHRVLMKDKIENAQQVVHHKDGNPSNNSLENLIVLASQAEHARLHGKR